MYEDIPEETVHDENVKFAVTGVQSNSVLGTIESLKGIDRERFIKYFRDQYRASNLVISAAGKMDCDELFEMLERGFGKLEDYPVERKVDSSYTINSGENKIVRETNQVHLCFNTRGVSLVDEAKYPAAIISSVLGGNMSSRLFQKLERREV